MLVPSFGFYISWADSTIKIILRKETVNMNQSQMMFGVQLFDCCFTQKDNTLYTTIRATVHASSVLKFMDSSHHHHKLHIRQQKEFPTAKLK